MSTSISIRTIRRVVYQCLKRRHHALSAILSILRHLVYMLFQVRKRCFLHLCGITRRLMNASGYVKQPVIDKEFAVVVRSESPGAKELNTLYAGRSHLNQQLYNIAPPSDNDHIHPVGLMYSCVPPGHILPIEHHSPQSPPYIHTPDVIHHEVEQTASATPVVSPSYNPTPSSRMGFPHLSNPRIKPIMPEGIMRYEGRHKIARQVTEMMIQPITLIYDSFNTPAGWFKCTHPEGGRYFYHAQKNVYTDADLCDYGILSQIMADLDTMEQFVSSNGIVLPEAYDLVLDLRYNEHGTIETRYYYLHHPTRAVFFLDQFQGSDLLHVWYEIQGEISGGHLKHEIEAQYWYHIVLYPHSFKVSEQLAHELLDMILHFSGDVMSSPTSASPFTLEELQQALTLAKTVKHDIICWQSVGAASLVSRLMHIFARSRFYNYYGERHARLERTASVFSDAENKLARTWFIKISSPLLFFIPDSNLRSFQKAYVDAIVHKYDWEAIMKSLNHEWKQMVLLAILMLNVNVGLLSVPEVERFGESRRSPAQIVIYLSLIFDIGSIALGSLLVRHHKGSNTQDYVAFLSKANHPLLGLEKPAILYSLPSALVIWSVVTFLLGVCFLSFQRSSIEAQTIVGGIAAIIAIFSVGTWSSWDNDMSARPQQKSEQLSATQETSTEETFPKSKLSTSLGWPFKRGLLGRWVSRSPKLPSV